MTLTEFLLARLADDEKWARQRRDEDFRKHRVSARRPHLAPDDAERVLAECEAKRRIVSFTIDDDGLYLEDYSGALSTATDRILRFLASVYADHPDFREEWRP